MKDWFGRGMLLLRTGGWSGREPHDLEWQMFALICQSIPSSLDYEMGKIYSPLGVCFPERGDIGYKDNRFQNLLSLVFET